MIEIDLVKEAIGMWELRVSCFNTQSGEWTPALILKVTAAVRPSVIVR